MSAIVTTEAELGSPASDAPLTASATWAPPMSLPKLYLLMAATFGIYSFFHVYGIARDVRHQLRRPVTPWLYPPSQLIGPIAAIAVGVLARDVRHALIDRGAPAGAGALTTASLVLIAHLLLSVSHAIDVTWLALCAPLLFPVCWMPLQHQLNRLKALDPQAAFRGRSNRFTVWQMIGMAAGLVVWAFAIFGAGNNVLSRLGSTVLEAGVYHGDPQQRVAISPSVEGWVIVRPGTLVDDDAALELLGPGISDWAVLYVNEQTRVTIDEAVAFRYDVIKDSNFGIVHFREQRQLLPGTVTARSLALYEGRDIEPFKYDVTTLALESGYAELIVYTAGQMRARADGRALAESLVPHSMVDAR